MSRSPFHLCTISILLIASQLLVIPSSRYFSLAYSESGWPHGPKYPTCPEFCNQHRPNNSTDAFQITCDNVTFPDNGTLIECKYVCQRCYDHEAALCKASFPEGYTVLANPFNIDESIVTLNLTCPSNRMTDGRCKSRCDYQRPDNFLGGFSFFCQNASIFSSKWEQRQCISDCFNCSFYYCQGYYGGLEFICPEVDTVPERPLPPPPEPIYEDGRCEKRCDKARPRARREREEGAAYQLNCYKEYQSKREEMQECISDCYFCPLDICDPELWFSYGMYRKSKNITDLKERSSGSSQDRITFKCPEARPTPPPPPPKPGTFIASWVIIALIAIAIIGCIIATAFYGRSGDRARILPETQQQQQVTHEESDAAKTVMTNSKASQKTPALTENTINVDGGGSDGVKRENSIVIP